MIKYTVEKMCKVLKISSNSYYKWRVQKPKDNLKSMKIKILIKQIFEQSKSRYGAPRICQMLNIKGFNYSISWISKLMKQMRLRSKLSKKFVVTTDSKHNFTVCKNHLDRNFSSIQSSKVWGSDITYIKVANRWNYLTTIIDLADRAVIGWVVSSNMTAQNTSLKA